MKKSRKKSRRIKKALLLLMSTAAALLACEVLLRTLSEEQLGFGYEDGCFTTPKEFERDPFRNRLGFHDAEPKRKRAGVRRVVLLGDSYAAALSVKVGKTIGKRLQYHLNRRAGRSFEVITLGQEDWGQRQELNALKTYGPKLEPDFVVTLFLSLNDVRNNSAALEEKGNDQFWNRDRPRPGWTRIPKEEAPLFFLEESRLNRFISFHLSRFSPDPDAGEIPLDYYVFAEEYDPSWEEAWKNTEKLLLETKRVSESLGAEYMLVSASTPQGILGAEEGLDLLLDTYPAMRELEWDLDKPDRRLDRFCEAHEIPCLRLEPLFREYAEKGAELHWRYDGHWNMRGNNLAGEKIAEFLMKRAER